MGMRVEAVWVDDAELGPTIESIKWFRPTGEPDADVRDLQGLPLMRTEHGAVRAWDVAVIGFAQTSTWPPPPTSTRSRC